PRACPAGDDDARSGRRGPAAAARRRAARRDRALRARRAAGRSPGAALGGCLALGERHRRGDLGGASDGREPLGGAGARARGGGGAAGGWLAVAVVAWWLWNTPRRPWLIAARVAFVTTVFVATTLRDVVTLDACRCLTVSFLDVGQGDAAVLRTPNGRWIVIDGGPRIPGSDAGRRVVVPFLRRHGAGRVALGVATHGDSDHLGGIPAVV